MFKQGWEPYEKKQYERAFEEFAKSLSLDDNEHFWNADQRRFVRELLILAAYRVAESLADTKEYRKIFETARKAVAFEPERTDYTRAGYEGGFDIYPAYLAIVAYAHCEKEDYSSCRAFHIKAEKYLRMPNIAPDTIKLVAKVTSETKKTLDSSDPYAVGGYVTNKGGLQNWIGRIIWTGHGKLKVRLTYTRADRPWREKTGDTVDVLSDEIQPLRNISIDALIRGYK